MAKDLLFEIGTEEIPARFMDPAISQIYEIMEKELEDLGLKYEQIKVYGTPRRLTLLIKELEEQQADKVIEIKGPSKKLAYDENEEPTQALKGFCRGKGLELDDLTIRQIKGVDYVYAVKNAAGEETISILPATLEKLVKKLHFPKPMRWGDNPMRFARPIRWLVALWDEKVLPVEIAGIKANNISQSHRFYGSGDVIIKKPSDYVEDMRENYVLVDQKERKDIIWHQIQTVAKKHDGIVKEDNDLLEEVVYLLEYPTALIGSFEESFLTMPPEMIITPMREHQRYFPVYNKDDKLLPYFIAVRNGDSTCINIVREGNEKVLRARLADADFFWQEDLKHNLEEALPELKNVVFHEKLGSVYDKTMRNKEIALWLAEELNFDDAQKEKVARAATLMKCDLISNAVNEFPELQGTMGKYYARAYKEKEAVANAIEEHYLPRFANDELPKEQIGLVLAIADRIDSITGFFSLGQIPTGSQDPYALRRQAAGVTQMIIRYGLDIDLINLIEKSQAILSEKIKTDLTKEEVAQNIINFFKQRLENILKKEDIRYDEIDAVLATKNTNLANVRLKAHALHGIRQGEDFEALITAYHRAANLVAKAEFVKEVKPELFKDETEKELYKALLNAEKNSKEQLAKQDYLAVLSEISRLRPAIDDFFTAVMVMVDEEEIKNNRLALLQCLVDIAMQIGDLSKLKD